MYRCARFNDKECTSFLFIALLLSASSRSSLRLCNQNKHNYYDKAINKQTNKQYLQEGQYERLQSLLSDPNASLDARCPMTGDTPLIAAARQGHERVVELLVQMGADLTLTNDAEESALEVASKKLRKIMLSE